MKRHRIGAALRTSAMASLVLGATGCLDYTIETTVNPDGTGTRVERMEVTRSQDYDLSGDDFRALTSSTSSEWTSSASVDADGDTTWILERREGVARLSQWAAATERPMMRGALPSDAEKRVGYVRLGDVAFRSSIQVAVTRRSDGTSLVSYRESLAWDQAADALVEFMLRDLQRTVSRLYPRLTEVEAASIVGFARARIWVAGEEGLFFGEEENEAIGRAAQSTAEHAIKLVRVRYPDADVGELRQIILDLLNLEDDQMEQLFMETLPGLNLGFNTEFTYRLTLPGAVSTHNAERQDGNTLEWEFNPLDNLTAPVEIFAEAVIGG